MRRIYVISGLLLMSLLFMSSCVVHTHPRPVKTRVVYVQKPPKHHRIVVVKGKRYYYWDGKYYRKTPKGFVVVKVR